MSFSEIFDDFNHDSVRLIVDVVYVFRALPTISTRFSETVMT